MIEVQDQVIPQSPREDFIPRIMTQEAPRHSFVLAVKNQIFDDILIGNFMKTTFHGKWHAPPEGTISPFYPDFTPYVCKYADNGRAKSKIELAAYKKEYSNRIFQLLEAPIR